MGEGFCIKSEFNCWVVGVFCFVWGFSFVWLVCLFGFFSAIVADLPALLEIHISSLFHWDFIGTSECNRVQADGEAKEYNQ